MFHIHLCQQDLEGAEVVVLPGDPGRVPKIAAFLEDARPIQNNREYCSYLGVHPQSKAKVLVMSTGIGGPSTAIAVEELALLGVKRFLRVGTTGAIQPAVKPGDLIITTAAVRMDGASQHIAPLSFPAVADFHLVAALVKAAEQRQAGFHLGVSASSDTFYQGQSRRDAYKGGFVPRHLRDQMEELRQLNVLSFEMEAGTLLTQTSAYGLAGACISGVLVNRNQAEFPEKSVVATTVDLAIATAIDSLAFS